MVEVVSEQEQVARIEMAREAAAKVFDADEQPALAADIRAGRQDHMSQVQAGMNAILATLRAGSSPQERAIALVRRIAAKESWQSHYGRTWEDEAAEIVAALAPAAGGEEL